MNAKDIADRAKKLGTKDDIIRGSSLDKLMTCPGQYLYGKEYSMQESEAMHTGSLFHEMVEVATKNRNYKKGRSVAKNKITLQKFPQASKEKALEMYDMFIEYDGIDLIHSDIITAEREIKFNMSRTVNGHKQYYCFSGTIDLLIRDKSGVYKVFDYKSGTSSASNMRNYYKYQLALYTKIAMSIAKKRNRKSANGSKEVFVVPYIVRIVSLYENKNPLVSMKYDSSNINVVFNSVLDTIDSIRKSGYTFNPGYHCRFCAHGSYPFCSTGEMTARKVVPLSVF